MSIADDRQSPALSSYFSRIKRIPALTREAEVTLAHRARAGRLEAAEELIRANLGIVVQVAKRYRNLGIAFEDLLAEGNVGLVEAARRFDPDRGNKFITYAIWWIRRAILKALNEQTTIVRVSYHQKRKLREIRRVQCKLTHALHRVPDRQELSEGMDETVEGIDRVLRLGTQQVGLDDPIDDAAGSASLGDMLACDAETSVEAELMRREMDERLAHAMAQLSDKERRVVEDRFGLSGGTCATLMEIGERMNLSRERVRQIECEARARLRRSFESRSRGARAASVIRAPAAPA